MKKALAATAFALLTMVAGASAQQTGPSLEQRQAAAVAGQRACERQGEDPKVCACGVGLAYAQLDPRVFVAVPDLEPLLNGGDRSTLEVVAGVAAVAEKHKLSLGDAQQAYEAVKRNRQTVREICKPLATKTATKK